MKYFYLVLCVLCAILIAIDIAEGKTWLSDASALAGWFTAFLLKLDLEEKTNTQ